MADFLTIKVVCEILRFSGRTAYERCRSSRLGGAVRVGDQWRIEKTATEGWVTRGGSPSDTEQQGDSGD